MRARVGMPDVEAVEGTSLSQDELRKIVRHERRVELAFEDLRLADLYRWGEWENAVKRMQMIKNSMVINSVYMILIIVEHKIQSGLFHKEK